MSGDESLSTQRQRKERRISVRLPMQIRGKDIEGAAFEESTQSENLCRGGAAFILRRNLDRGASLEIRIPLPAPAGTSEAEFSTVGRVVHIAERSDDAGKVVGVEFTGPRFRRIFQTESGGIAIKGHASPDGTGD
jgi:c-di-GMP-binding flagellar brake protein YcgR